MSENRIIAVCPADRTVTAGIYIPVIVMESAVKVNDPEGFVSEAA